VFSFTIRSDRKVDTGTVAVQGSWRGEGRHGDGRSHRPDVWQSHSLPKSHCGGQNNGIHHKKWDWASPSPTVLVYTQIFVPPLSLSHHKTGCRFAPAIGSMARKDQKIIYCRHTIQLETKKDDMDSTTGKRHREQRIQLIGSF
jgi:hypothetical protein